jgi:hypothetical protein
LLFDGQTTAGWQTNGQVTTRDGMLVLTGGRQSAEATFSVPVDEFDLTFEFQMEQGRDGQFCIRRDQGESGIGLGHLSFLPHSWNRVSHEERPGKTFQEIIPKKHVFRLVSLAGLGNVYGSGSWRHSDLVSIRFQVLTPGDRLVLRSIKFKPLDAKAPDFQEKH